MFEGETEAVTAIIENAGEEESILYLALLDKTMTPVAEGGQLNEDYLPSSEIISSVKNDLKSVYTNTFFDDGHVTYFMPIIIEEACLECHDEMKVGDFQGAVQVTLQTIAIVKAQKNNAIIMWLSSIGIIVIVSGVLLIIMQIIVIKPLQKTIVSMKDIAQGEGDLTVRLGIKSNDELGELGHWFDIFVEKLQDVMGRVKNSTQEVALAGEQITTVSEEMASGALEQQEQLDEVVISIEEMTSMLFETNKTLVANSNK